MEKKKSEVGITKKENDKIWLHSKKRRRKLKKEVIQLRSQICF